MAYERPRKRTKRDSAPNLYAQCQITGNCPDDVKNKIEGNTLADKLLRIFSSIVYFGGLGIGTGKGTGGATGYRPLGGGGGGGRVTSDGTVIRPNIVVEPVGPSEIVPIDALSPGSSSIVPMVEAGPELIIPENIPESVPDINAGELEIITEPDTIDISGPGGAPAVSTIDDNVAILEVQPTGPPPRRVATSTSRFSNPSYMSIVTGDSVPAQGATSINVFVDAAAEGVTIGEEIPLDTFNEPEEFEIEDAPQPRSSTPLAFSRAFGRARDLYNRRVRQVMTRNLDFLARAPQAIQFQFENPAFDNDITLEFQQDLNQLAAAAPDPDFADIVKLQRPRFSETEQGNIRLSRLGTKGTIRLRSGTQIGETVHFYYDLSSIENAEAIELSVLGEHSGESTIVNPIAESSLVDAENSDIPLLFPENELLDDITEDFSNSHVVLSGGSRRSAVTIPTLPPGTAIRVFIDDFGSGLFVSHPVTTDQIPENVIPATTITPSILIDSFSSDDFILHPSHLRKRKRKRADFI
uniref:Minor capsid protein L2 n=1 Tax=Human papillomavirus TaxID=10566 RepID=A0A385PI84_9PAPI|nr:MAG: L2 protein [Human papillomavirus]